MSRRTIYLISLVIFAAACVLLYPFGWRMIAGLFLWTWSSNIENGVVK